MAHGELVCIGTQMHLKNRFGDGLRLKIAMDLATPEELDDLVNQVCANNKLVFAFGTTRTYLLPKAETLLSKVFEEMEGARERNKIKEFSLSQTSLEEVFIKVVSEHEGGDQNM